MALDKREQKITTKIGKKIKYLIKNKKWKYGNISIEAKSARDSKSAIPFSAISEKQWRNVSYKSLVHKFSDFSRMGTPYDMIVVSEGLEGYFFMCWGNEVYMIEYSKLYEEKFVLKRSSLTKERAGEIGELFCIKI